eukprot:6203092-Alexandrium_andersonii.AAC.1
MCIRDRTTRAQARLCGVTPTNAPANTAGRAPDSTDYSCALRAIHQLFCARPSGAARAACCTTKPAR